MGPGVRRMPGEVRDRESAPEARPQEVAELERELREAVDGEVRFDAGSRGAYSTDASNYRYVPLGVVVPRSPDAAAEAIRVCARHGVPLLHRGGGTSLAGQGTNTAVVIDWSKYCHRLVSVDPEKRRAVIQPGIALDDLNRQLEPHRLQFGPRPSTHVSCALGGMIGNNSCGSTAQMYGKTVDNVHRLEVMTYDGTRMWVGPTDDDEYARIVQEGGRRGEIYRELRRLRDDYLGDIRQGYPKIPRRVSGYCLDSLLPEMGFDVARALVGSEGTLVTVLHAEIELVPTPRFRRMLVLGYSDVYHAADHVTDMLPFHPLALEGLDSRLISFQEHRRLNRNALGQLPEGSAWLMVQLAGDDKDELDDRVSRMRQTLGGKPDAPSVAEFDSEEDEAALWEVRESALGATARPPAGRETWGGWEDAAVPPDRLGEYLRDFRDLLERYGLSRETSLYGHFGQGCVHCRIPFELRTEPGLEQYRRFVDEAAHLVVSYGGSLSGEHGDGQSRGSLLPIMFGPRLMEAHRRMKGILDPGDRMNPGRVVDAAPVDTNLRLGTDYSPPSPVTWFGYPKDGHSFAQATLRCVGVGRCRNSGHSDLVMCPSYQATREEEHSTRGRARLLFEMMNGEEVADGWRSEAVREALDLCLSCKGCKHDCPVNVDMATYKAEFLAHHYQGRLRPMAHYSMGWLPLAARPASLLAPLTNAVSHAPGVAGLLKRVAGVAQQRTVPPFASQRFTTWFAGRRPQGTGERGQVVLWPDTFTNHFDPEIARAAVTVLEAAGFRVIVPRRELCCGLTWISTGQLGVAKAVAARTVRALAPAVRRGIPVVGLEPSCTATFRSDYGELFPEDEDVRRLERLTLTLPELLEQRAGDWLPEDRMDVDAVVQVHCHHHAIMGADTDRKVMEKVGVRFHQVDPSCCGLAGNFGFEAGHYDVSMACAEHQYLPAVRDAKPDDVVVADGFSCRTQLAGADLGRTAVHAAEVLAAAVSRTPLGDRPEDALAPDRVARERRWQ